jgi:maltooligosyltrehalose trehalohydrolase
LQWNLREENHHKEILNWYQQLITLRKSRSALRNYRKDDLSVSVLDNRVVALHRTDITGTDHLLIIMNFSDEPVLFELPSGITWEILLDSSSESPVSNLHALPKERYTNQTIPVNPFSVAMFGNC